MTFHIRPYQPADLDEILRLSILAWEPIFTEWEKILGSELYPVAIYPDWRKSQREVVENIIKEPKNITHVAVFNDQVVGFIVYGLNPETRVGEVQLLAVNPDDQNRGVGTDLNLFALEKLKEGGMKLAVVGTGGDAGHAPARRSYEKAGYTGLPLVRYYKALE